MNKIQRIITSFVSVFILSFSISAFVITITLPGKLRSNVRAEFNPDKLTDYFIPITIISLIVGLVYTYDKYYKKD